MNKTVASHNYFAESDEESPVFSANPYLSLSYTSFEKAKQFLEDFYLQVSVYLTEMSVIEKSWDAGKAKAKTNIEEKLFKQHERDLNRIFEKLRDRICNFMEHSQGVKLE